MYEWLVAQMGVGGALGLAFGSLAVLFLVVVAGLAWQIYRFKKNHTPTNTGEMILHDDAQLNIAPSDEDEMRADNLQRRLTLCDSVMIDNERRIILVRRDDVEHLIMIGGAGDMIIEHNIPVDVPSLDPVSMLAIAQVEAEALINESIIHEKTQTQPLVEEDAASPLPEDVIGTKSQEQAQEIIESKSEDSPSPPSPSPPSLVHESITDEKIVQTDSTMASLFPGRMGDSAMPAPQEEQDTQAQQDKQNNNLQDPPIASYFAGQPKRVEPIQKPQNDTSIRSNIEPLPRAPIAPQEHAPIKDQQNTPPRILPLNPFFHASSPLKKPDNIPPATPSLTPAQSQPQTHSSNLPPKIAAPEPSTPPEPQGLFINSFLGFPLQQLTKPASELSPPAHTPPLIKTYGQPTPPALLKKSNS